MFVVLRARDLRIDIYIESYYQKLQEDNLDLSSLTIGTISILTKTSPRNLEIKVVAKSSQNLASISKVITKVQIPLKALESFNPFIVDLGKSYYAAHSYIHR